MTYYEAALQILRSTQQPLTTRQITEQAIKMGLITPRGKTPKETMAAELYRHIHKDPELVKLGSTRDKRAKRGSVRWSLRSAKAG